MVCVPQGGEYLAGYVSFEATNNLSLAHPLGGAVAHICLGSFVMTQPDDYNGGDAVTRRKRLESEYGGRSNGSPA